MEETLTALDILSKIWGHDTNFWRNWVMSPDFRGSLNGKEMEGQRFIKFIPAYYD
jgi:hypothetical protein